MTAFDISLIVLGALVYIVTGGFTATVVLNDNDDAHVFVAALWPVVLPIALGVYLGERWNKRSRR